MSPRPQPYGLSTGRGQFERFQQGGRSARRPLSVGPEIVGFAKASTPPTETANNDGSTIVIPKVGEVGDFFYGIIAAFGASSSFPVVAQESGYTFAFMLEDALIVSREIQAGDPSEYTYTAPGSGRSRSGCIGVLRDGNQDDSAFGPSYSLSFGTLNTTIPNSVFFGLAKCHTGATIPPVESFAANSPLTLGVQHVAKGTLFLQKELATCIAFEVDLPVGSISGRSVSNSAGAVSNRRTICANYG